MYNEKQTMINNKISHGMKKYTNKIGKIVLFIAISLLVGVTAYAGSTLTPPGTPAKTMKSLSDLYELINTGANTPSTDFTTPSTITTTMNSIGDTYDLLKTKIDNIDASKILTGTTIFGKDGTATVGTSAPTFASADQTSYNCSSFTTMTDPTQPSITSADICGYNAGCSWNASTSQCDGGEQTGQTYMTWYAGKASCASSTEGGQTAGTWRLPTYGELVNHYVDNNQSGGTPSGFQSDDYWSGTTYPSNTVNVYYVNMSHGLANNINKDIPNNLALCAH